MSRSTNSATRYAWLCLAALIALAWMQLALAQDGSKKFILHTPPKPVAAIEFEDGQEQLRNLADFKGKILLLNVWATWCVPCRKEMPALDRLQAILGESGFKVLPLSIDRGGMDVIRKFYAEVGIKNLGMFRDRSGNATRELGAVGIPTTLLIDAAGREIGRLIGPAEWDSPEMVEFIKCSTSLAGTAQPLKEKEATATAPDVDIPAGGMTSNTQQRWRN